MVVQEDLIRTIRSRTFDPDGAIHDSLKETSAPLGAATAARTACRNCTRSIACARFSIASAMRSDRGNSVFSLVTLSFSTPLDEKQLSVLSRILGERLRATDDVGWLGTRQIGAVLPETRAPGAWKVADDICDLLPTPMRPDCDVYTYPQNREQPEHCTADSGLEPAEENRRARTMQTLFVRPLPLWKRGVDITGAITGLVVLAPLMLLAAVAIKATSRGPVLFAQRRHTLGGRSFTIYKFRTMCVDAEDHKAALCAFSEQDGPAFKMTNDPRVTRLGRFCARPASTSCRNYSTCSGETCRSSGRGRSPATSRTAAKPGSDAGST